MRFSGVAKRLIWEMSAYMLLFSWEYCIFLLTRGLTGLYLLYISGLKFTPACCEEERFK